MTLLGAFFIPVAILYFLWWPERLLPLLIIASVFEAGTVINGTVGRFVFGISPYYFVAILVALRLLSWAWNRGSWLPSEKTPARGIAVLLLAFVAWSFGSGLILPHVFTGLPVYAPREMEDVDMVLGNLAPLQWSLSNLAQGIYLILNVAAVIFAFHVIQTTSQTEQLARALRWAVVTVVAVGVLQHLALQAGWSYPYSVFNNNPNNPFEFHPLDQQVDGFLRFSSTLSGPVYAGSFLAAISSGLLASYLWGRRGVRRLLGLVAVFVALLASASTTGYLALAVMLCPLLIYFNPFAKSDSRSRPTFLKGWTVLALTLLGTIGLALLFIPNLSQAAVAMTFDKSGGISFASRMAADSDALTILEDTYGLGAGLGSSRHSSLILTLLSTVGLVGTSLFGMAVYRVVKLFPTGSPPSVLQMSFWSFIGLLVAQSIAVPDINRPMLWALLLVVVAQSNVYWSTAGDSAGRPITGV